MHHGTIMFDSDLSVVSEALRVDPTKIQTKGIRSVRSRVTNVAEHLPEKVTLPEFRRILLENILKENPGEAYPLTQDDLAAVESCARSVTPHGIGTTVSLRRARCCAAAAWTAAA